MKRDWKQFVVSLPYEVSFLHRNELPKRLSHEVLDLPCLRLLLTGTEFREIKDLQSLKERVSHALSSVG